LSRAKLIAEPWDLGEEGYQLGRFPAGWGEWNDKFRDSLRTFWRGDSGRLPALAKALSGSAEIYASAGRQPSASINYVTSHDGFTLNDLVSYNERHNETNGEGNRDGHRDNYSWNCGIEGDTEDQQVLASRALQKRNFLASLLLAKGTPMLLMGDELSRSQAGNNNPYCQDNETSWLAWSARGDSQLLDFIRGLTALRSRYNAFRRDDFYSGKTLPGTGLKDIYWLAPEGHEMKEADWAQADRRAFGLQIGNDGENGERFLLLLNAASETIPFQLAADFPAAAFVQIFDTTQPTGHVTKDPKTLHPGQSFHLAPHCLVLFQHKEIPEL
jgi:glycogen operon protein